MNPSTKPFEALLFDIDTLLNVSQAEQVLWLSASDASAIENYRAQKAVLGHSVNVHELKPSEFEELFSLQQRFDIAIVYDYVEHLEKKDAIRALARLRDFLCPQYCLALTLDEKNWQLSDLLSLGLSRVSSYARADHEIALFKYSISNYKQTPDWLNADNWANPKMWGKYWW